MRQFFSRVFRRTSVASGASTQTAPDPAERDAVEVTDYPVLLELEEGAGPVLLTLGDLFECETRDELRQRAAERVASRQSRAGDDPRPDPADYKGRPIGDFLTALGSTEDTSHYARERGITTVFHRLGRRSS